MFHFAFKMNATLTSIAVSLLVAKAISTPAWAQDAHSSRRSATFSTLITTPLNIEGMTGDNRGNLYVAGRDGFGGGRCPVWRVNIEHPSLVVVGFINPSLIYGGEPACPGGLPSTTRESST